MRVKFHNNFERRYLKFSFKLQTKIDERIKLFSNDQFHRTLNNHALKGKYLGCRSINITGDYRAVYQLINNDLAYFLTVDNHNNLYK